MIEYQPCPVADCDGNNRHVKVNGRYVTVDGERVKMWCGFSVAGTLRFCPRWQRAGRRDDDDGDERTAIAAPA